jgi:hypothetical protein
VNESNGSASSTAIVEVGVSDGDVSEKVLAAVGGDVRLDIVDGVVVEPRQRETQR